MIPVRSLIEIDRSLPDGIRLKEQRDGVIFRSPSSEWILSLTSAKVARYHIDRCRFTVDGLEVVGWAFDNVRKEPMRRVFLAHGNSLLAVATPDTRVDVRRKLGIDYDRAGFRIKHEARHGVFEGDNITIYFVGASGIVSVTIPCKSILHPPHNVGAKCTFEVKNGSAPGIVIDDTIYANGGTVSRIEAADISDNHVEVVGWCFGGPPRRGRIFIGLLAGQELISPLAPSNMPREDVTLAYSLPGSVDLYGFNLRCKCNAEELQKRTFSLLFINPYATPPTAKVQRLTLPQLKVEPRSSERRGSPRIRLIRGAVDQQVQSSLKLET